MMSPLSTVGAMMIQTAAPGRWVTGAVIGIVLATFFSDVGHEMVTATLPLYLGSIGLGAAALGAIEGFADLAFSLSKLAGGWVGHHTDHKRRFGTLGYLLTLLGTAAIALTQSAAALVSVRSAAWFGRGFRSPLRDSMLSDEVGPTHFGRAYGIERAADMLGAVAGPLVAFALLQLNVSVRTVILISIFPSALAVAAFFGTTRDHPRSSGGLARSRPPSRLPSRFWLFTAGVGLFGIGDFSRTFLILLATSAFAAGGTSAAGGVSAAVLLYTAHNAVSAIAAYPAGARGDRGSKLRVLMLGYGLGVVTNVVLAFSFDVWPLLVAAVLLSGIYIAVEETIEKAVVVEMLPRDQRSLGLGVLASANAAGDMISSVGVGLLLSGGHPQLAFLLPAAFGFAGLLWMMVFESQAARS